jgi:hypothetical protein
LEVFEKNIFFRDLMKKWNPKWPPWGHYR